MAELLIRVVSKVNLDDIYKDVKLTKRGDVIVAQPDGWLWGSEELRNPDWRILKWPSISVADAQPLLSEEIPDAPWPIPGQKDPMLQRRGFYLDVDSVVIPNALRNYINDASRTEPFFVINNEITLIALKIKKAKRIDPHVIG